VGDLLSEIPMTVRKEVLCEVFGWLRDFLDVDANSLSFMWLQPERFHLDDWANFAKKLGIPGGLSGKAAQKAVTDKVKSVLDRPHLLSLRRLRDPELEIFLPAIADLVCNDTHIYTDIEECREAIAGFVKSDFSFQVKFLNGLTVAQLQDLYVVAGGSDKPAFFNGPMHVPRWRV
jgi:hypothetical protein